MTKLKLNYLKMLQEIDVLVNNDFCNEMEYNSVLNSKYTRKYTQKEAKQMADLLGKVYSISHCIHCKMCQRKYLIDLST